MSICLIKKGNLEVVEFFAIVTLQVIPNLCSQFINRTDHNQNYKFFWEGVFHYCILGGGVDISLSHSGGYGKFAYPKVLYEEIML